MKDWNEFFIWVVIMAAVVFLSWVALPAIMPLICIMALFILAIIFLYHSTAKWSLVKWCIRSFYLAVPFFIIYSYFMVDFEILEKVISTIAVVFFLIIIIAYSYK